MPRFSLTRIGLFAAAIVIIIGCDNGAAKRAIVEKAQAQVQRITDDLDKRTTETGVYIRVQDDEIKENDPWGTPIQFSYSQGGVAEVVSVRSAGPDCKFQTNDDIVAQGIAANLKGIGEGIKKNTEDTAAKAAKGLVNGTVEGVKDSVKDAFSLKKKKDTDSDSKVGEVKDAEQPPGGKPTK